MKSWVGPPLYQAMTIYFTLYVLHEINNMHVLDQKPSFPNRITVCRSENQISLIYKEHCCLRPKSSLSKYKDSTGE